MGSTKIKVSFHYLFFILFIFMLLCFDLFWSFIEFFFQRHHITPVLIDKHRRHTFLCLMNSCSGIVFSISSRDFSSSPHPFGCLKTYPASALLQDWRFWRSHAISLELRSQGTMSRLQSLLALALRLSFLYLIRYKIQCFPTYILEDSQNFKIALETLVIYEFLRIMKQDKMKLH